MANETCGTCRCWVPLKNDPNGENKGVCRFNPPIPIRTGTKGKDMQLGSFFPMTMAFDWCAQWRGKMRVMQ